MRNPKSRATYEKANKLIEKWSKIINFLAINFGLLGSIPYCQDLSSAISLTTLQMLEVQLLNYRFHHGKSCFLWHSVQTILINMQEPSC